MPSSFTSIAFLAHHQLLQFLIVPFRLLFRGCPLHTLFWKGGEYPIRKCTVEHPKNLQILSVRPKISIWNSFGRLQNTVISKCSQSEQQPSLRRPIPNADWQKEEFVEKFTKRCVPEESCYYKLVMLTTKESLVP